METSIPLDRVHDKWSLAVRSWRVICMGRVRGGGGGERGCIPGKPARDRESGYIKLVMAALYYIHGPHGAEHACH